MVFIDSQKWKNVYLITIDRELIHEFHQYYIKKHPTAKTLPFAKPRTVKVYNKDGTPSLTEGGNQRIKKQAINKNNYVIGDCIYGTMSLNEILVINNRMTMNQKKEKWGELGCWIVNKYGLKDLNISNSVVEYRVFSETKANKDNDNVSGGIKFISDGFVKGHMFIDDNYNHINPLIINCDFDKTHPRTEIRITTFDDSVKDVYTKMSTHIDNFK